MNIDELAKALRVLTEKLDPKTPLRTAMVFAEIAAENQRAAADKAEKPDMGEVGEQLNMTSAQLSRDVGLLSQFSRSNEGGGLDVVEAMMDLADRRKRRLGLTKKGQKIVDELMLTKSKK